MTFPVPAVVPYSLQSEFDAPTGAHLDANFAILVSTLNSVLANLELIERDDGVIRNQSVTSDSFDTTALALIAGQQNSTALRWTPRGTWLTATAYAVTDIIETGSPATSYVCSVAHTSGVFATDHAAGKWVVLSAPRTLISADVTGALGYTPVNKAGDTMTGALVLVTGSKIGGASGMVLSDALLATQDDIFVNKGWFVDFATTKNAIVYGYAAAVVRTAGANPNFTVGSQFDAISTTGVSSDSWGIATEVMALAGATGALTSHEAGTINTNPSNTSAKTSYYAVFKNRSDGATNPGQYNVVAQSGTYVNAGQGLGANKYNSSSRALWIISQSRTATGEFCGWTRGVYFDEYSLDSETDAAYPGSRAYPIGIDFSNIHYYGGSDPVTSYNLEAAIALRAFQNIWWNRDPPTPNNPNKVRTYFDSNSARWVITNGGLERFGIDVATGELWLNAVKFVGVTAAGNNNFTGANSFSTVSVLFGAGVTLLGSTRIVGDFSNATFPNRTLFVTSAANSQTELSAIPNGASTTAGFSALSNSTPANCSYARMAIDAGGMSIESGILGAGAYLPMRFYTNGSERARFNTSGQLLIGTTTAPVSGLFLRIAGGIHVENCIAFAANKNNVDQGGVADVTLTKVTFTTEDFDQNSSYDAANSKYTPPAGTYRVSANVTMALPAAGRVTCLIYKNGAAYKDGHAYCISGANYPASAHVSFVDTPNGTDYYEVYCYQNSGVAATVTGLKLDSYWGAERIG